MIKLFIPVSIFFIFFSRTIHIVIIILFRGANGILIKSLILSISNGKYIQVLYLQLYNENMMSRVVIISVLNLKYYML